LRLRLFPDNLTARSTMTTDQFWTIVGASRDKSIDVNGQKLFEHLCVLSEQQIIAFDRIWTECYFQIYTSLLRGVAHLARGRCTDERFKDWRHWAISRGRKDFETARDRPDDLVPLIDSEPEAGREGIVEVIARALRARNSRWEDAMPNHDGIQHPSSLSGPEWHTDDDLKALLPKTYARYRGESGPDSPPASIAAPAPTPVAQPEPTGPPPSRLPVQTSSNREPKEIPVAQSPVKKPWWKFWG
jgi:hypothetical protein